MSLCGSPEYPDIKQKCIETLSMFGTNLTDAKRKDKCFTIRTQSKQLALYLEQFKKPNTDMDVPFFMWKASAEIRASYLAGLMDADGCATSRPVTLVTGIYKNFMQQVQNLYSSLGIPTRLKVLREEKGTWKKLYTLVLSGSIARGRFLNSVGKFSLKSKAISSEVGSQRDYGFSQELFEKSNLPYRDSHDRKSKQITFSRFNEYYPEYKTDLCLS